MFYVRDERDLLPVPTFDTFDDAHRYAVDHDLFVALGDPSVCANGCGNKATTRPGICDICISIAFGEN